MRLLATLCMVAMVPAALNTSPAKAASLSVPLCAGDGLARTVSIPVGQSQLPGTEVPGCCVKGCQSSSLRKRSLRRIDSAQ